MALVAAPGLRPVELAPPDAGLGAACPGRWVRPVGCLRVGSSQGRDAPGTRWERMRPGRSAACRGRDGSRPLGREPRGRQGRQGRHHGRGRAQPGAGAPPGRKPSQGPRAGPDAAPPRAPLQPAREREAGRAEARAEPGARPAGQRRLGRGAGQRRLGRGAGQRWLGRGAVGREAGPRWRTEGSGRAPVSHRRPQGTPRAGWTLC